MQEEGSVKRNQRRKGGGTVDGGFAIDDVTAGEEKVFLFFKHFLFHFSSFLI
ncbi:hypothetical protein AHAS_Ahas06G0149600 [Arachis hypogaea]